MISSLIGGGLVALTILSIALLRGGAAREPKPLWARGEAIESMVAVSLVFTLALGIAMVLSSARSGWIAPAAGLAVAAAGSIAAILFGTRRRNSAPGPVAAPAGMA